LLVFTKLHLDKTLVIKLSGIKKPYPKCFKQALWIGLNYAASIAAGVTSFD